jgi:hypothetical protein
MKASLDIFPAYNEIYGLGFSQEKLDHLSTFPTGDLAEHKVPTDLQWILQNTSSFVRVGNMVARKVGRSQGYYRDNNKIIFNKLDKAKASEYAITDYLYFGFKVPKDYQGYLIEWSEIGYSNNRLLVVDELTQDDLPKISIVYNFIKHFLNGRGIEAIVNGVKSLRFKRFSLFIDKLRDSILTMDPTCFVLERQSDLDGTRSVFLNFFNLAYPRAKYSSSEDLQEKYRKVSENWHLSVITDVVEYKNRRFALSLFRPPSGYYKGGSAFYLRVANHEDRCYDYVDVDRCYVESEVSAGVTLGAVAFIDSKPQMPTREVLEPYVKSIQKYEQPVLMTNKDLAIIVKRHEQRKERERTEAVQKTKLAEKISQKIEVLKEDSGKLNVNGVLFTKNAISYENQSLIIEDSDEWVYNLVDRLVRSYNLDSVNFDTVLARFLDKVEEKVQRSDDVKGQIGDVTFHITRAALTNRDGNTSRRTYINEKRINLEEVKECIERGLCFQKQDDFNYFLYEVSKCSLKIHKCLQRGITMNVRDEFNGCVISMKLPLTRKRNINYLVMEGQEFRVKDTHKIIDLRKANDLVDVLNVFLNPNIIDGVNYSYIKGLVEAAKKEFVTAVEKSQKLLKETEETFNLTVGNHQLANGKMVHGYLITGKKRTYVLEVHEDNPEAKNNVYIFPEGSYVCIVDKSTAQVGMDKVVNRIYALHNDSMLAAQIHTLK